MTVRELDRLGPEDAMRAGTKATTLASLKRSGFKVPPGFVVLTGSFDPEGRLHDDARTAVLTMARGLGTTPFAVRSSALAEDLADASHAGQYLTVLGVRGDDALIDAIHRVRESGRTSRVAEYRGASDEVAVLVQPMLAATAAGVAFTADPITGERDVVVVNAVAGLGDRLVGGETAADEWRVRDASIEHRTSGDGAIDPQQARAVADVARRIAEQRGVPQDIEWAFADGTLHVLQARPMTALPDAVRWEAPSGAFARNFRLGEWIGEPVTPLFESWLLTTMEETMHGEYARLVGQPAPRPLHVVVNGWYYYSLNFLPASVRAIARMLPGMLVRLAREPRRIAPVFPLLARFGIDLYVDEWRRELLPTYRAAVEGASAEIASASPERLRVIVNELAVLAGRYFTSLTFVAGYGWKTEIPLSQFYRRHLQATLGGHPQFLLRGLVRPTLAAHDVQSLDWSFPTQGELGGAKEEVEVDTRYRRLAREREDLERRARDALPAKLAGRFTRLLAEAQRAAVLREEQVSQFTLAWPVFRRALARIGDALLARGVIAEPQDLYFLERGELFAAIDGDATDRTTDAVARRARRTEQGRLIAPLVIGHMPKMLETLLGVADRAMRDPRESSPEAVRGVPASPGRATGRARVVRTASEFGRLEQGEVLVCPVTTPLWTPLFARAAAVVTDVGSPASHASIIAREYGIPAVVGTGDGTSRIRDGERVTVDGGAGLVLRESV
jgi:phosphohistidine swiveling domain-containing protein